MSGNINPLKFSISGNQYFKNNNNEDSSSNAGQKKTSTGTQQTHLSSDDVLGFMAAQNTDIIPVKTQKTLDVSKYVTSEEKDRISEFIGNFEADYDEAYSVIMEEFPEISETAAGDLALSYINASYSE